MNQRLAFIDNSRGILMLLVIIGHSIQFMDPDFDNNIVFRYIYSFHMPLFMCISGFVCFHQKNSLKTIKKRFCQLMIPFISWSIILCCIDKGNTYIYDYFLHPDWSLWFLWALFFITIIFMACKKFSHITSVKLEYITTICAIVMLGAIAKFKINILGGQFIGWYFIFYTMGYFIKKYNLLERTLLNKTKWISLTIFVFTAYFWMRKDAPLFMHSNNAIYNYAYKLIVATISFGAWLPFARTLLNKSMGFISKIGKNMTLGIYSMQQIVIIWICSHVTMLHEMAPWLSITIVALSTTIICYCAYILLDKNKALAYCLFGHKRYIKTLNPQNLS